MEYFISTSNVRGGTDYKAVAQFEADNVRGMAIDAKDEIEAVKQFNRYVDEAQTKWRPTANGIDWGMQLLVVLVGVSKPSGKKHLVRWVVKENKKGE